MKFKVCISITLSQYLVQTSYRHNPLANPANPDFIIKEVHYYVYDDPNHDSLFV